MELFRYFVMVHAMGTFDLYKIRVHNCGEKSFFFLMFSAFPFFRIQMLGISYIFSVCLMVLFGSLLFECNWQPFSCVTFYFSIKPHLFSNVIND